MKFFLFFIGFLLAFPPFSNGQLCVGSLGDPLFNETFGSSNGSFSSISTSYQRSGGCPVKGNYSIANLLFNCAGNTWFLLAGDHTGDPNGNYMVINAEGTPGTVLTDTVTGLCANTTYQFGAWVMNVMQKTACGGNAVLPTLTFTVETLSGTVLSSYTSGAIRITDNKEWVPYGVFFKTTASITTVVFRIKSNAEGGCGNAFAIDDVTVKACGPSVAATLDGNNIPSIDLCADYSNPLLLEAALSGGLSEPLMQWQSSTDTGKTWKDIPGATTTAYSIPRRTTGIILYRMTVAERLNFNSPMCRIHSNSIWTNVHPVPLKQPKKEIVGCLDKDLQLSPTNGYTFYWTGPNGFQSTLPSPIIPKVQYKDTGIYRVLKKIDYGCSAEDTFHVQVYPSATVTVQPVSPVCEGTPVALLATGGGKYRWSPSAGLSNDSVPNPVARLVDSTNYKVTITNNYGCKDSAEVMVAIYKKPFAYAGADKKIVRGDTVTLDGVAKGSAVSISWAPPQYMDNSQSLHPKVYPPQEMVYTLSVKSAVGCGTAISAVRVTAYKNIFIPSAFTPNNDGRNDRFNIPGIDHYKLVKLLIYNRWGGVVYKETNTSKGWDGLHNKIPAPAGTYVYFLELLSPANKRITKQGTVTLIR